MDSAAQEKRTKHGHEGEGEEEGAAEGEHHRERHGAEHLPLDSREGQDRNVDHGDDDDPKEHGRTDLLARGEDGLDALLRGQGAAEFVLFHSEAPDDVLNNDHRPVDDQAEVHRSQAHQISGNTEAGHSDKREEK